MRYSNVSHSIIRIDHSIIQETRFDAPARRTWPPALPRILLLPDWITPSVPLARYLNAAVVAAAEKLAVHQRHGPHVLAGIQELGAAVPAEHLEGHNKAQNVQHSKALNMFPCSREAAASSHY
ncbi:hypothetical protein PVAP13_7NG140100 [Panicum virgatum]|uniref:Uncharacterized protein n=1 Tax=Panicum virgatum TaxID=38727 RepID=A0A8T0PUU2_PANVG|nr:hypothetical protein PVAP13_7NG140100 [Panicum virgatum]